MALEQGGGALMVCTLCQRRKAKQPLSSGQPLLQPASRIVEFRWYEGESPHFALSEDRASEEAHFEFVDPPNNPLSPTKWAVNQWERFFKKHRYIRKVRRWWNVLGNWLNEIKIRGKA